MCAFHTWESLKDADMLHRFALLADARGGSLPSSVMGQPRNKIGSADGETSARLQPAVGDIVLRINARKHV